MQEEKATVKTDILNLVEEHLTEVTNRLQEIEKKREDLKNWNEIRDNLIHAEYKNDYDIIADMKHFFGNEFFSKLMLTESIKQIKILDQDIISHTSDLKWFIKK